MESSMVSLVDMIMSVSIENHVIQVTQSGYIKIERPQRHLWIAKNNIYRQNAFFLNFPGIEINEASFGLQSKMWI